MAIIYGISQSERSVIKKTPNSIKTITDVDEVHEKLASELYFSKKKFFESLPDKIKEKEKALDEIENNKKTIDKNYDDKIKQLDAKKAEGPLQSILSSIRISSLKHYSKPKEMREIQKLKNNHKTKLQSLQKNPQELFDKAFKEERQVVQRFNSIKDSPEYKGAKGEVRVLDILSQLSDDFHVFCDVQISLPKFVHYRGKKNLGSAQMDFVVVSTRGVVMIEVKNWSTRFIKQYHGLPPHEQTERASLVLWIALKSLRRYPKVTSVLLSVQDNMSNDPNYKHVIVSNKNKINQYIKTRKDNLPEKEVKRIVTLLQKFIPK